ncbi:MAG: hypothetical protein EGQ72_02290 [Anaeroglobus sp.]|nr:hypothetical protein [Anaeroglobus sp.]
MIIENYVFIWQNNNKEGDSNYADNKRYCQSSRCFHCYRLNCTER